MDANTSSATMLSDAAVTRLRALVLEYRDNIDLPPPGRWKTMTDAEIWVAVVGQVSVVGSSGPGEKLVRAMSAQPDWFDRLSAMDGEQRRSEIHATLRRFGVRYSMEDPRKCRKTAALLKNFTFLQRHGGPRAYIERLARWSDERTRVNVVGREMAYIRNKGPRDLLIGLGLNRDGIALDVRVLNVLEHVGASLPADVASNPATYALLEDELMARVCQPEAVSGSVLDRILYQKYEAILAKPRCSHADHSKNSAN